MSIHDAFDAEQSSSSPFKASIRDAEDRFTARRGVRDAEEAAYLRVATATQIRLRSDFYAREAKRGR